MAGSVNWCGCLEEQFFHSFCISHPYICLCKSGTIIVQRWIHRLGGFIYPHISCVFGILVRWNIWRKAKSFNSRIHWPTKNKPIHKWMQNQMEPIMSANLHFHLKGIGLPFKRKAKNSIERDYKSDKCRSKTIQIPLRLATGSSPQILKWELT